MNTKKMLLAIGLAIMIIFVSACGSNSEPKDINSGEPIIIGEKIEIQEQATSFSHIHGLSIHPNDSNKLLLASHYGLIEYDKQSQKAFFVGSERFDLMGYSKIPNTSIIMTSGHPGEDSNLPDPLGFLWSEDFGQTWEVRGLHGMIDFHALSATADQTKLLGYGSDYNKNVIFVSNDHGFTWEVVKTKGLPLNHDEFFDLGVSPTNGNIAYAATNKGLYYSNDGGVNWDKKLDGFMTALYVLGEDEVIFYEARENGLFRLQGEDIISYDLYLGADAVNYIVVGEQPSSVTVSTFQNILLETENHGDTWETILQKGEFPQ